MTRRLAGAARLYSALGLARLAERLGLAGLPALRPLHRLARAVPLTAARLPRGAGTAEPADLELFVGCMGELAQGRALQAALTLLARLGRRVRLPSRPACCGALHRHNGLPAAADQRRDAVARRPGDPPLVGLASACVLELRAAPGTAETWEFCAWLERELARVPEGARDAAPAPLRFRPLAARVLVHEPCSHRLLPGGNAAVYRLLGRVPGLEVAPLPGGGSCCGAAGTYLLQQPDLAGALLADTLAGLAAAAPDLLVTNLIVTTNPGCALHLSAGLREAGLAVEVCHPAEVLARQVES